MALFEKLKEIKTGEANGSLDWDTRRERWIQQVHHLFSQIQAWLSDYESQNYLSTSVTMKPLNEEHLGAYEIEVLTIKAGLRKVILDPVGSIVIGGEGRIDFYRSGEYSARFMLILTHFDDIAHPWLRVPADNKTAQVHLTKEVLEETIELLISDD